MNKLYLTFGLIVLLFIACNKKEAAVRPVDTGDPATLLSMANQFYQEGNKGEALRLYETIYNQYPTSREYIDGALGLSRCYNDMGDFEKGMDLLYNLVRENMVPSRVPQIYNEMARYYEVNAGISSMAQISDEEQDYQKAIQYYQKAIAYPNSDDREAKAYAQYRIGELYLLLKKFKDAAMAYKNTKFLYPNTIWAQTAEQRLTEMKQAVNSILNEMKESQTSQTAPAVTKTPEKQPDTTKVPAAVDTTAKAAPDTTAVSTPENTTPPDTMKTTEPDTSRKPELDLK